MDRQIILLNRIRLCRPDSRYARQVMDFRDELLKNGDEFDGCAGLEDCASFEDEFLLNFGGNIGYSVRPSERRKGYAFEMLRLLLGLCHSFGEKQVLLTCDSDNTASRKTILKNGGVLENEITDTVGLSKSGRIQRYWVSTIPCFHSPSHTACPEPASGKHLFP